MNIARKFLLLSFVITLLFAKTHLPKNCYLLELSSIGFPTAEKGKDAWSIHDLLFFNNKLYIGYGNAVVNTGPTDVLYYDLKTKKFNCEFTIDEEALYYYQFINNTLMIPGIDATEDWTFGNFYILTDTGWIKKRTIPNALHVNYLATFKGKLFASTGSLAKMGKDIDFAVGAIFSSPDQGKTWILSYTTPGDENSIYRVNVLIAYKEHLYAFPYAYRGLEKNDIPEKYHTGLSDEPREQGYYLILRNKIFGTADALVFDGSTWQYKDIIPLEKLCYIGRPIIFKDKLLIPCLSGEYIDYLNRNKEIPQADYSLWSYDGRKSKKIKLAYDKLLDILKKEPFLYLLIKKDDFYYIVRTKDLKNWDYFLLPPSINTPRSIEVIDTTFYIGTEDGNIFEASSYQSAKDLKALKNVVPEKIFGAAELPCDGKWYWITITDWQTPGKLAKFFAEVKFGNIIKVKTENISGMRIFLPRYHLVPEHDITLIINNEVVYEAPFDNATELICQQKQSDDRTVWQIEKR